MGHSTATWEVSPAMLEEYEKTLQADAALRSSSRNFYGIYGNHRESKEEKILSIAIRHWQDEEAGRYEDARPGTAKILPPTPIELGDNFDIDRNSDDYSLVMPIMDKRDYTIATKTMTLKLDNAEWQRKSLHSYGSYGAMSQKIVEMDPTLKGMISGIEVKLPEGEKSNAFDPSQGWKVISTIETDTSGGKTKTVYNLSTEGRVGKTNYDSQALARAAANELMKKNINLLEIDVVAKVIRENGNESVVSLKRVVRSATAKVIVKYVKVKSQTPRVTGWVAAFDYHH